MQKEISKSTWFYSRKLGWQALGAAEIYALPFSSVYAILPAMAINSEIFVNLITFMYNKRDWMNILKEINIKEIVSVHKLG